MSRAARIVMVVACLLNLQGSAWAALTTSLSAAPGLRIPALIPGARFIPQMRRAAVVDSKPFFSPLPIHFRRPPQIAPEKFATSPVPRLLPASAPKRLTISSIQQAFLSAIQAALRATFLLIRSSGGPYLWKDGAGTELNYYPPAPGSLTPDEYTAPVQEFTRPSRT